MEKLDIFNNKGLLDFVFQKIYKLHLKNIINGVKGKITQ